MKTRNWTLGLVLMMALLVGASASTAEAITFSYTFSGCDGDTICMTPVLSAVPDSIQWFYASGAYDGTDIAPPFDTCFVWNGAASGRDSVHMHAWYAAVDSNQAARPVLVSYMIAMSDGVTVPENGTIGINVRMNDTTSTPDSAWIRVYPGGSLPASQEDGTITNGPDHGTIDSIVNNTMIWYTPDLGYNGTDDFVYSSVNACGDYDTALVAITITSNGLISFDKCVYTWKDVPCDCDDSAKGLGAISIGDSLRVCAFILPSDLDELTAGWPQVDLPGLAGLNLGMVRDTSADLGMLDTSLFCWPGRTIDSANTWFEVTAGNLDVAAGFYEIVTRARSTVSPNQISACTTIVAEAIDNNDPDLGSGEATWTLWHDVNGDGIATTVDSMRFFIDLRNEPFEEICQVCVTTIGFPHDYDTNYAFPCLYEIAGDNRWGLVFEVPPGNLEDSDGPFTAIFRYTDNACNVDSVIVIYNDPVDNTAPTCANIETTFESLVDLDSNNCISLGETVRIGICDTNSINSDVTYWLDVMSDTLWRFGLGSDVEGVNTHDSIPLELSGDCGYVNVMLHMFPLENAIDTSLLGGVRPSRPWVYLRAVDDAGNPFDCDSLQIVWDDPNDNIDQLDARPPQPMHLDACIEDTTFLGTRAVRIRFSDTSVTNGPGFGDIARFRLFYDNGTGVIDYADTLAGLSWDDTTGGAGTDGLIRIDSNTFEWTTDGTVELSWCRDYLFNVWVKDSCGNLEYLHPDSILCEGTNPAPVADLSCSSEDALNICLTWTTHDPQADSFRIYMATNEDDDHLDDTMHYVATVEFTDTGDVYTWCTDDAGLTLLENVRYDFYVVTVDTCGNEQEDLFAASTSCLADLAGPVVCVFQPATLAPGEDTTIYSCDRCEFLPSGPFDPQEPDGMWIYTKPCNDTSIDVTDIDSVLIRLADSAGTPGRWVYSAFDAFEGPNHWAIRLNGCERPRSLAASALAEYVSLDDLVREDDSVEVVQVVVFGHDAAGRAATLDEIVDCCGYFEFVWSNYRVDVIVETVNGEIRTYQPECGGDGFAVSADGENTVQVHILAGVPPYKVRSAAAPSGEQWADEELHQIFYMEGIYDTIVNITFSTVGWEAGLGELDVEVCDAEGNYSGETEIPLCVPDTIPPCAIISNPVDGKCIRRSRSMLDPVWVCLQLNPLANCLDPNGILKVDFQWSQECCTGFVMDTVCEFVPCEVDTAGFEDGQACTTFANPASPFFGQTHCVPSSEATACTVYAASSGLDSTICFTAVTDTSCRIEVCRLVEVPCENVFEWNTFSILPGDSIDYLEDDHICAQWWNTEDLAWITQSGTIIYLRAILYDQFGNQFTTPCTQVCVDIDETPLCLETPDICPSNGYWAIGGGDSDHDGISEHEVTFYANMDIDSSNVDDIEDVSLWFKKSTDPDLLAFWHEIGSGFLGGDPGGTNSTVWRWDIDLDNKYDGASFGDNISYDFRVIVTSITGTTSHDANGDGNFDANTFDSSACDMNTYYIDKSAPQVAMDTVWTTVNGEPIVEPNVSCAMSDPRGWAWTQFGNELTVQPNVYPWFGTDGTNFRDDIKRVRWTLWDDDHTCECGPGFNVVPHPQGSCFDEECNQYQGVSSEIGDGGLSEGWVVGDFQNGNPMQNLTFDPSNAPWFDEQFSPPNGVSEVILRVEVWDSCGNYSEDCITIYLLDIDPTDAILVEPENDNVFCTEPGGEADGGILLRAAAILGEGWNKVIYAYRPAGTENWIEFDSVGISSDPDRIWQQSWTEVYWEPIAMGLEPGDYELTAWAVDNALNRSTFTYPITIHLSCAVPSVQLVHPTSENPEFIGCDIELEAIASTGDPWNPIEYVNFYYVRVIDDIPEEEVFIGSDNYSVDDHWGFHWIDPTIEGPHYIFARAWNRAGQVATSELVWVKGDDTDPWGEVKQVGSDLSNGSPSDPTIIESGETVPVWGWARDVDGGWGEGEVDNCGVDSVVFSVHTTPGTHGQYAERVAAFLMLPDGDVDSVYNLMWNTTGLAPGNYNVRMQVYDCACNGSELDGPQQWFVRIVAPDQELTISTDGQDICGYPSSDGSLEVSVTVSDPEFVGEVWAAYSSTTKSDIVEQYEWIELYDQGDGLWTGTLYTDELDEGLYRLRGVWYSVTPLPGGPPPPEEVAFGDFTFDESLSGHMIFRVDHGVSPFTITPQGGETFQAHTSICFDVDIVDTCDFDHVHFCTDIDDAPPSWDDATSDSLSFCFNPVDSSCVTLSNCGVWSGEISMTVCDPFDDFDHCETVGVPLWILDVAGPDTALITSPNSGSYMTPSGDNTITARKLSSSGIDSVQFYFATAQTGGTSTYIGSSAASGDEFTTEWDIEGVANGGYYLFARAFNNNTSKDSPRCVFVTVAQDCTALALKPIAPSYTRTVNGQTLTFVGDRVDLCIDEASITAGAPLDSVVWYFRAANAPGNFPWENDDPMAGWVRIAKDTYGSLCVDWWTDWCPEDDGDCCSDGRFAIVAYVFDQAGNICHSVPTTVNIDNTEPYSEIVDIDGDETFGDCHEVVLPADSVLKITANAIDISCLDSLPKQAWASGAKYLQFFVGQCGGGGGCVDIVFVQDGSGSMGDDQAAIATNAQLFANALGNVDYRLGVLGYDDGNYDVIGTDGSRTAAAAGDGVFTTDISTFQTMITAVGDGMGSTENGLTALNQALTAYPFRSNCNQVLVLVTDEDADDFADYGTLFPTIANSGAVVFGVINFGDSAGYSQLGIATGGELFDISASWGANLAAVAGQIQALAGGAGGDVGVVWGKQVTLTDGQDDAFALWNPSGLEEGTYCAWTVVIDNVGNLYTSSSREMCIVDETPPTAWIAGFGKTTDQNCNIGSDACVKHKYSIYGESCDLDIDHVQFQYRLASSTNSTDWTGIGIPVAIGCDTLKSLWMTEWNPCLFPAGPYQFRIVPTDKNGNQDFEIQPMANITITQLTDGSCDVLPTGASTSNSGMWFEDKTFEQLGLVDLDLDQTADGFDNSMIAVWADLRGAIDAECVALYAPDPDIPSWLLGSFDGISAVKLGGEGWFWQAYTDNANVTHLKREVVTVWPVRADLGACNKTHPTLGAKVCIQPGALPADNGIVVFPSRIPTVNWSQQHYQAWPAASTPRYPVVTAIHLTYPVDEFNPGKYAQVTIKYREPSLDNSDLTVGWWDDYAGEDDGNFDGNSEHGGQWDIEHGILPATPIDDSSGSVYTTNLHGLYAIVSAGRQCIAGAITVENAGMEKAVGNVTGPWPTIYTRVRSNIEFNNNNYDLDEDQITVVLDGNTTLFANGSSAERYEVWYDHTSGILTANWLGPEECLTDDDYDAYYSDDRGGDTYEGLYAPALTSGTHTLYVQAFNDAGYCSENTFTFTVDRSSPNIEVVGYEDCANPTFHIKVTDEGPAGVDWENVFVDVFDITGSEFDQLPKSRLVHTETYDAFNENLDMETGEFSFQLVSHIAQGRRLRIVIYNGDRYVYVNHECNCEYVDYDHDCQGVQDLVGNRTQIVEEQYTIWGSSCSGGGGTGEGDVTISTSQGSGNPFDPWAGGSITFNLNGFDGGGAVNVEVFDVAGVKVADLSPGNISSTVGTVTWDGRNEDAEYVAQGVYLVHFARTGGQAAGPTSQVLKVVVKRGSQANTE